jgi:hypothetical protein
VTFECDANRLKVTNGTPRAIARGVHLKVGRGGQSVPFGAVPAGGSITVDVVPSPFDPLRDLGYAPDSFAGKLLKDHFQQLPHLYRTENLSRQKEFLVCVLEEDGKPSVGVDARLSSDSRTITLLQVLEGRP